jgi:AbrB family looped-hinge helix DNA binding protein
LFPYVTTLVLDDKGRIVIPQKVRDMMGLVKGSGLKLEFVEGQITIRRVED